MKRVLAGCVGLCASASLAAGQEATTRVSVDSTGQIASYYCINGTVSDSGRFVAFRSLAGNLVPNDTNGADDVFVRDRDPDGDGDFDDANGVTSCMSLNPSGFVGDNISGLPALSADGRHVAFWSWADNLVANDTNGAFDVFVRDRDPDGNGIFDEGNGVTVRVSVGANGAESDGWSFDPDLSADGRYVVFESDADNLIASDTNQLADIFVFDRDPDGNGIFDEGNGVTTRMSIRADGGEAGGGNSAHAHISANGRHVAFESDAFNLVDNDTNGCADVFVHDRDPDGNGIFDEGNGAMARLSVSSSGVQGNGISDDASISGDGRHVAFVSRAINLVSGDTNRLDDVFAHDRDPDGNGVFDEGNGVTTRMSIRGAGLQGNASCGTAAISGDGRIVAFDSGASNLVRNDTNSKTDVFTRDRDPDGNGIFDEGNGVTARVSVNSCDLESDGNSYADAISADGRTVVFESYASNLVADGIGGTVTEIFVRDRSVPPPDASWNNYGTGYPGTFGVPALTCSANPVIGTTIQVDIGNSLGAWTVGLVLVGASQANAPTNDGGTLLVTWSLIVPLVVWPGGSAWSLDVPDDWTLCRDSAFLQVIEFDAGAQYGLSFSQGLELIVGN